MEKPLPREEAMKPMTKLERAVVAWWHRDMWAGHIQLAERGCRCKDCTLWRAVADFVRRRKHGR